MLTYDEQLDPTLQDLARQAYLLTGDAEQAHALADRAFSAGQRYRPQQGPAVTAEQAKAELLRAFMAEPGSRPAAPSGAPVHPDVAVWQAVRRLPPRRRAVIVLRYDEGLTEEHAAARLGTSPQSVRADVDAAMLTLRTALPGIEDPWTRIADALSAAGRGWSDYTRPAPARVAEVLAAPRPEPRSAPIPERHSRRLGTALAAAGVAAVLLVVALVVPRLGGDPAPTTPAAGGPAQQVPLRGTTARLSVPTQDVPQGLLNWPARGPLAEDESLVAAATTTWKGKVPAAEAPNRSTGVLWAGSLQARTVVVLQSLDRAGRPHVAQLSGRPGGGLSLQHAEPLHEGTAVLSLLPPSGPSGPVRVLVSPEAQVADGLLTTNPMSGKPLQPMAVGDDGVSPVLPSPPGTPTCSRVVLLGLDSTGGPVSGARVLYSGIVSADMLGGMPGPDGVEVGSPTLAPAASARPETGWFADGMTLAKKVPGKGVITVATLGPRVPSQRLTDSDQRVVSARAYELRRGSARYVGSVVELAGKTICASVRPVGATTAWAERCPVMGTTIGLVHVIGAPRTQSVDLSLQPTPAPPGQQLYTGSVERPADAPADYAFAVLQVVPSGFPCGTGTVTVHRDGGTSALRLPVYLP